MISDLLASVIVSGLGAALAYGATRAWVLLRAVRLRQLSSLDGAFVTQYEQEQDGQLVMRRALTQMSQMGLRVRGITTELESDRSWELEGEIDQSGFLRGTYRATGSESTSARTLLLAIDRSGDALSGLWASCDAVDCEVTSGQYAMQRCSGQER